MRAISVKDLGKDERDSVAIHKLNQAAKVHANMVLPRYCKVAGLHGNFTIITHFLDWTVRYIRISLSFL